MKEMDNYKTYDTYKPSGVEWLGDIPTHWEVRRNKFEIEYQKGKNPSEIILDKTEYIYLSMEYLRSNYQIIQYIKSSKNLITVDDNDMLLLWDGSNAGEIIKGKKGILSSTMAIIKFKRLKKNYAWNYFKIIESQLRKSTIGMGIPHVNGEVLRNLCILLPPKEEQTRIANFLDEKTALIEKGIEIKQKQIELLKERRQILIHNAVTRGLNPHVKMKASGVEWIGEIPEHWEIKKIKHVTTKIGSGITPSGGGSTYLDSGIPLLRSQNVLFGKIEFEGVAYISDKTHTMMSNSQVKKGDVLLNITGGSIGRCHYVELDTPLNVNQHVCIVRPSNQISTIFLNSLLASNIGQDQIWYYQQGGGREGLNFQSLKNFWIPLPPIQEQVAISEHIETMSSKISTAITFKEMEIEKLKEYKATMINSVVTGKVKI